MEDGCSLIGTDMDTYWFLLPLCAQWRICECSTVKKLIEHGLLQQLNRGVLVLKNVDKCTITGECGCALCAVIDISAIRPSYGHSVSRQVYLQRSRYLLCRLGEVCSVTHITLGTCRYCIV